MPPSSNADRIDGLRPSGAGSTPAGGTLPWCGDKHASSSAGDPGSSPGGSGCGIGVTATHDPSTVLIPVRSGDAAWAYCRREILRAKGRRFESSRPFRGPWRRGSAFAIAPAAVRRPPNAGVGQWQAASTPSRRSRFDSAFPHGRTVGKGILRLAARCPAVVRAHSGARGPASDDRYTGGRVAGWARAPFRRLSPSGDALTVGVRVLRSMAAITADPGPCGPEPPSDRSSRVAGDMAPRLSHR